MKKYRIILIIVGVAVLAIAPMFISDYYSSRKSGQEALRAMAVEKKFIEKLEAYQEATGNYPDSKDLISFTNSPQEIEMLPDIEKINYRRTQSGYAIRYDGESFHSSSTTGSN